MCTRYLDGPQSRAMTPRLEEDASCFRQRGQLEHGVPVAGGTAPGIDRIVMLIAGVDNLRGLSPMNQQAQDLMMNAPSEASLKQLRELHIRVVLPEKG